MVKLGVTDFATHPIGNDRCAARNDHAGVDRDPQPAMRGDHQRGADLHYGDLASDGASAEQHCQRTKELGSCGAERTQSFGSLKVSRMTRQLSKLDLAFDSNVCSRLRMEKSGGWPLPRQPKSGGSVAIPPLQSRCSDTRPFGKRARWFDIRTALRKRRLPPS